MSSVDTWNKKLWPKIKRDTHLWLTLTQESSLLWLQFIGKSEWPAGYWVKHQKTDYLDIQLVEKGNMTVKQHGKNYLIEENKIVLMPPGAYTLSTGPAGHLKKRYLGLKGILVAQHQKKLGLERINIFSYRDADDFDTIFDNLYEMSVEQKPEKMLEFSAQCYKMLLYLSQKIEQLPYPRQLLSAKSFIDWGFALPISLDDICDNAECGKTTLLKLFRQYLKQSPVQYLTARRMQYAELLLHDFTHSIKEVAVLSGYQNQMYFSNVFRKHFNCSPKEYRKKMQATLTH